MPINWDDRARTTLFLKLIAQNPAILSRGNADIIAASWPGSEKPSGRAITEQFAKIRKQLAAGNFAAPATPRRSGTSSTPRTPKTPAPKQTPATTSSSTKRANKTTHHTPNDSSSKKRKLTNNNNKTSDSESEEPELTSSADDTGHDQETTDNDDDAEPLSVSNVTTKRTLPARSKSRSKSYVAEADSAGEDDCAKDPLSDDDAEFSLDVDVKGKDGGKKRAVVSRESQKQVKREDALLDESTDDEAGLRDERDEMDSDADSRTTAGKSHQTFVSALDDEF